MENIYIPLEKLDKLGEQYDVRRKEDEVEIVFITPSIAEAASNPELGAERRRIIMRGVVSGDVVKIAEAYVEDEAGKRTRIDVGELELWAEYVKNL